MRLNMPAGTAVRFEPGDEKVVTLVELAGAREVHGLNALTDGPAGERAGRAASVRRAAEGGYLGGRRVSLRLPRRQYADLYGPTVGDRVRLADTELLIEVERDFTSYGDEVKFGGGKVIRDGMGQSARATARPERARPGDHQRADPRSLGHREGRHRHPRRPHRRRSARRAIPTSWRA